MVVTSTDQTLKLAFQVLTYPPFYEQNLLFVPKNTKNQNYFVKFLKKVIIKIKVGPKLNLLKKFKSISKTLITIEKKYENL